jgi:hypothetical protein
MALAAHLTGRSVLMSTARAAPHLIVPKRPQTGRTGRSGARGGGRTCAVTTVASGGTVLVAAVRAAPHLIVSILPARRCPRRSVGGHLHLIQAQGAGGAERRTVSEQSHHETIFESERETMDSVFRARNLPPRNACALCRHEPQAIRQRTRLRRVRVLQQLRQVLCDRLSRPVVARGDQRQVVQCESVLTAGASMSCSALGSSNTRKPVCLSTRARGGGDQLSLNRGYGAVPGHARADGTTR